MAMYFENIKAPIYTKQHGLIAQITIYFATAINPIALLSSMVFMCLAQLSRIKRRSTILKSN
jgi:hypothetical protein